MNQKIHEYQLDTNPPRAARTYALAYAAILDVAIACWDAKYHSLVGRPIHFNSTIDTLWNTYPLAAYPSGYACNLTSAATVLAYRSPRAADYFPSRVVENAASRTGWHPPPQRLRRRRGDGPRGRLKTLEHRVDLFAGGSTAGVGQHFPRPSLR